ncbi:MAG: hypothetical protein JWL61_1819 [Gemmatimonadetes bacterium]|nr:hypothetical protein [Gemmatimonadota bacterium]
MHSRLSLILPFLAPALSAQDIRSLGQPVCTPIYADAILLGGSDAQVVGGAERAIMNPVLGVLSAAGEAYAGRGAGVRAIAQVPAIAVGLGMDWNVTRSQLDVLLTYRSAIRRGGLLGRGTMLRVDWLPGRSQTIGIGLHVPLNEPLAGRTRPRRTDVTLPRGQRPSAVDAALINETTNVRACSSIWDGPVPKCADVARAHHDALARVLGPAAATRARAGLLDHVLLPYDTLFGQVKEPADRIDGLTARAHASFARWLTDSSGLAADVQARVLATHAAWLVSIERVHADLLAQWKDSRFIWLPLTLALAPEQFDEQTEIDSLIARAVGRPFSDENALTYLQTRDIAGELARSVEAARRYHVLWTHDFAARRIATRTLDNVGYEMVADVYYPALTAAVRRYDSTGVMPAYMIFIDQYFYEPRGGRLWMTMLEDPMNASLALPGDNAAKEGHLRERQAELRAAVAASERMRADPSLRRLVKVHVNVTDPSDFSFRSHRIVPPLPFTSDNMMRDHRKMAFYDLDEADPWRGSLILMGVGVGEHFASSTWEDRGYRLRGPATLEARAAARRVLRAHGFRDEDIPEPLREVTPGKTAEQRMDLGDYVGRAIQVHNEVGWGAKMSSVVRAMLFDLVQPGTVIVVPDPQWVSREWAAMLAGSAARGARVFVIAPAVANAPTATKELMGVAHDVMLRLLELARDVGELRVGLFTGRAETDDGAARASEVRTGIARAPWIRDLFPFGARSLAVLEASEARAASASATATSELAKDQIKREPKIHQKTQLIARPSAIGALIKQPGWDDALAKVIELQSRATARVTTELVTERPVTDTVASRAADSVMRAFERGLTPGARKGASFYFAVGTHNMDPRGLALDAEATLVTSGVQGVAGVVDLYNLMARSTWIDDRAELERLLPEHRGFMAWLTKVIWVTM